jgi:hypothetical protein
LVIELRVSGLQRPGNRLDPGGGLALWGLQTPVFQGSAKIVATAKKSNNWMRDASNPTGKESSNWTRDAANPKGRESNNWAQDAANPAVCQADPSVKMLFIRVNSSNPCKSV